MNYYQKELDQIDEGFDTVLTQDAYVYHKEKQDVKGKKNTPKQSDKQLRITQSKFYPNGKPGTSKKNGRVIAEFIIPIESLEEQETTKNIP